MTGLCFLPDLHSACFFGFAEDGWILGTDSGLSYTQSGSDSNYSCYSRCSFIPWANQHIPWPLVCSCNQENALFSILVTKSLKIVWLPSSGANSTPSCYYSLSSPAVCHNLVIRQIMLVQCMDKIIVFESDELNIAITRPMLVRNVCQRATDKSHV